MPDPLYTPELAARVCELIALNAEGLDKLREENDWMPPRKTIWRWRAAHPEFAVLFDEAKRQQMGVMMEDIIEIADDSSNDLIATEGGFIPNSAAIARARIQIDARKWTMAKIDPGKYGDRVELQHSGTVTTHLTLDQFRERVAAAKANRPALPASNVIDAEPIMDTHPTAPARLGGDWQYTELVPLAPEADPDAPYECL